jgi:hypothetical protein
MVELGKLQLLHTPSGAQTAITGALLSGADVSSTSFAEAIDILNVAAFGAIRVELFGVAADTNAITTELYGWPEAGGGHHIGSVTAAATVVTPVFAPTNHHASVQAAFPAASTWRACDTYAVASDEGVGTALTVPTDEANMQGYFNVDFTNTQYSWFALVPTVVAGTSAGATFAALSIKQGYNNPQFTG